MKETNSKIFYKEMSPSIERQISKIVRQFVDPPLPHSIRVIVNFGGQTHTLIDSPYSIQSIKEHLNEMYLTAHPTIFNPDHKIVMTDGNTNTVLLKYGEEWAWVTIHYLQAKILLPFFESCGLVARRYTRPSKRHLNIL